MRYNAYMAEKICEVCGKSFVIPDAWARRGGGRYCSYECRGAAQDVRVTYTCEWCGKRFKHSRTRPRRFCSRECWKEYFRQPVYATCERCGQQFPAKDRNHPERSRFCSYECRYPGVKRVACQRCGKLFYPHGRDDRKYCSEDCRRPPLYVTCQNCGKVFRSAPAYNKKFCSVRCYRTFTGETEPEKNFRLCLTEIGEEFEQEVPLAKYPVDFYLPRVNLAVEIDSIYWHRNRQKTDAAKMKRLTDRGYRVIRVPDTPFYGAPSDEMLEIVRQIIAVDEDHIPDPALFGGHPVKFAVPLD